MSRRTPSSRSSPSVALMSSAASGSAGSVTGRVRLHHEQGKAAGAGSPARGSARRRIDRAGRGSGPPVSDGGSVASLGSSWAPALAGAAIAASQAGSAVSAAGSASPAHSAVLDAALGPPPSSVADEDAARLADVATFSVRPQDGEPVAMDDRDKLAAAVWEVRARPRAASPCRALTPLPPCPQKYIHHLRENNGASPLSRDVES